MTNPGKAVLEYDQYTIFPFRLVEEIVGLLRQRGTVFQVFADLDIRAIECQRWVNYAREYARFKTGAGSLPVAAVATVLNRVARRKPSLAFVSRWLGWRRPRTPVVVLHHDADRQPHKTVDMMRFEERLGVVSSNYFFVQRCARWPGDDEAYDLDFAALREMEGKGFEIGYHLNAMERAGYDDSRAEEVVEQDLAFLRQHLKMRTFVPHGGVAGPGGLNNQHISYRGELTKLVWAYHRLGFYHDVAWSDGGIEGEAGLRLRDPRNVAASLRGRMRGHFLLHPQYYGHKLRPDWHTLPISGLSWWRRLWGI